MVKYIDYIGLIISYGGVGFFRSRSVSIPGINFVYPPVKKSFYHRFMLIVDINDNDIWLRC